MFSGTPLKLNCLSEIGSFYKTHKLSKQWRHLQIPRKKTGDRSSGIGNAMIFGLRTSMAIWNVTCAYVG
jgi:hypothetical protein